jgi:exodeoxyribonuclease VII large subunit
VWTVSEIAQAVKSTLELEFGTVLVQGEISGYKVHTSGHHYFELKDRDATINVAFFKGAASRLRGPLESGMAVQVEGELTAYAARSQYQIIATRVEPVGYGALQAQFEALKRRLQAEGLFAPERKRLLPRYPMRVGIVTSASGAALRDMLRMLRARAPYLSITLADAKVQGEGAAEDIGAALKRMNEWGLADVIIVGRGGGSAQDLWAFNEEPVVRAIVASRIPVVSAVGHEVDFTLADLAADVRAATPTHAAELVVRHRDEIQRTLRDMSRHAKERLLGGIRQARERLRAVENHHALRQPERRVQEELQKIDHVQDRLSRALGDWVLSRRRRVEVMRERVHAHAPSRSFARARERLQAIRDRAIQTLATRLSRHRESVEATGRLLDAFDHRRVLERGYALVWTEGASALIHRGGRLRSDDPIEVQFYDARAGARVTRVIPEAASTRTKEEERS